MLEGVMLLWFLLEGISLLFVAIDIRATPESPVLKWGFVLLTAYTGVFGSFLYVIGCREPLPRRHETLRRSALAANAGVDDALRGRRVHPRWRRIAGSGCRCRRAPRAAQHASSSHGSQVGTATTMPVMALLSFAALAAGLAIAYLVGPG